MRVQCLVHSASRAIVVPVPNGSTIESLAKVIAARAKVGQVELYTANGAQLYPQDDAAEVLAYDEQIVAFADPIQAAQHQRQLLASDLVHCSDFDQEQPPPGHLWQTARPAGFIFLVLVVVVMAGYSQMHSPPASTVFELSATTVLGSRLCFHQVHDCRWPQYSSVTQRHCLFRCRSSCCCSSSQYKSLSQC